LNVLKKLTDKHNDWIAIVKSFGVDDYAEDLVQEMYVRVIKYLRNGKDLSYGDDINYYYIYMMLRHMTTNLQIKKSKFNVINIDDYINKIGKQTPMGFNIEEKYKQVIKKLNELHWYDKQVYEIIEGGTSIKELSEKSHISYYSLYRTYNKVKKILKEIL